MGVIWTPEGSLFGRQARDIRLADEYADAAMVVLPRFGAGRVGIGGPFTVAGLSDNTSDAAGIGVVTASGSASHITSGRSVAGWTAATVVVVQRRNNNTAGWHNRLQASGASTSHWPYTGVNFLSTFATARWVNGTTPVVDINLVSSVVITARTGDHRAYENGVLFGSSTGETFGIQDLTLGDSGAWSFSGATYLFVVLPRVLPDKKARSLSVDPWQMFEPAAEPIFYSLGGGGVTIDANVGAAVADDYAANVASPITVSGAVGAALASDYAAGVSSAITIAASTGAAVASDYAANVASAITVAGSVGAAVGAGLSATVSAGATISAAVGAADAAGLPAGVASPITVAASAGAATASGLPAGISTGNEIAAGTGAAVGAGLAAAVASPITVAANVGAASAAGLQATVSTGATIPAGIGAAIALGLTGNIAGQIIIPAALGRALAVGLQASITVGDEIAASVGAATAAGLASTIANPTVALTAATGTRGGFGVQMQLAARRAQIQTGRRRN